ncbi:MAG: hypothetical protein MUO40_12180 [Anaerolineaceae bacterium]|nr:hypothetical protein [Anaerolineaceae bacterium]
MTDQKSNFYPITPEWFLTLDEDFQRRMENDQLVLWTTGKTIITVAFRLPKTLSPEDLLLSLKSKFSEDILETFESQEEDLLRYAALKTEESAAGLVRLVLHGFTISQTSCLQSAFYFDLPADLAWAKTAWQTIVFIPDL